MIRVNESYVRKAYDDDDDKFVKFYVYRDDVQLDHLGFNTFDDAKKYADLEDGDSIDRFVWYSKKDYRAKEPADEAKTVWTR